MRPTDDLRPKMLLKAAGTRPEPAVSVPSENGTTPRDTTVALPDDEPPLMWSSDIALGTAPYGERVPTSPAILV